MIFFLFVVSSAALTVAQDRAGGAHFYEIDVVEIAIAADVELPAELADSLIDLAKLRKNGGVILHESLRFSAMANRQTTAGFGVMVNSVQGVVERAGMKLRNFSQEQTGTQVSITVEPGENERLSVKFSYQAKRVSGETKEDEPMNFSATELSTDAQIKLRVPHVLLARSESDRRFIILTVRPQ